MDTLKIKAFLLVVKHKNFSLAAKELSYTPSALSHIADSLENELGVKLFNRTRKGVEITEDGKMLYEILLEGKETAEVLLTADGKCVGWIYHDQIQLYPDYENAKIEE